MNTGIPADAFRYYLLINRPETADTTFTWHDFGEKLNNELVATLGNLINRTITFINRYTNNTITNNPTLTKEDNDFWTTIKQQEQEITTLLENVKLKDALKKIMDIARKGNTYFQQQEPWKTIKEQPDKARTTMYILAHLCRDLAILLQPYLPTTSKNIFQQLKLEEQGWDHLGQQELGGHTINKAQHLFKKISPEDINNLKQRFSGKREEKTTEKQPSKEEQEQLFSQCDFRVAKITSVKQHPRADKLYIETIDLGPLGTRQIISGLVGHYKPEELINKNIIVITNLKPATLRGELSQGMLLAAQDEQGRVSIITTTAPPGTPITIQDVQQQPATEITINEFSQLRLTATKKGVYLNNKELRAGEQPLRSDKGITGNVS